MIDLQVSRKQIDEIDSQIVKLFEERMKVANVFRKYVMVNSMSVRFVSCSVRLCPSAANTSMVF